MCGGKCIKCLELFRILLVPRWLQCAIDIKQTVTVYWIADMKLS